MSERTRIAIDKLTVAELMVARHSRWKHKNGGLYRVLGHVIDTDNGEVRVRYQRFGGPDFNFTAEQAIEFVRPLSEWTLDRFVPLD